MSIAGVFTLPIGLIFIGLAILFGSVGKTYKKVAKIKSGVAAPDIIETPPNEKLQKLLNTNLFQQNNTQKSQTINFRLYHLILC